MHDELIIDASVAVKFFIDEEGAERARALLDQPLPFLAPDLIFVELASVAAKRVRRGDVGAGLAEDMLRRAPGLFVRTWPSVVLMEAAYGFAAAHGLSAYDGVYLALARRRSAVVITADAKLVARAGKAGHGDLLRPL